MLFGHSWLLRVAFVARHDLAFDFMRILLQQQLCCLLIIYSSFILEIFISFAQILAEEKLLLN